MTTGVAVLRIRPLEMEVNTKKTPNNTQLALLIAGLTIPVPASAKLLSSLLAKPMARHSLFFFGTCSFTGSLTQAKDESGFGWPSFPRGPFLPV